MKIPLAAVLIVFLTACSSKMQQTSSNVAVEPPAAQLNITGHYFETLNNDPETLRKGVEIELVVAKEKALSASDANLHNASCL